MSAPLCLTVESIAGPYPPTDAIRGAFDLAFKLGIMVHVNVNDVDCYATSSGDESALRTEIARFEWITRTRREAAEREARAAAKKAKAKAKVKKVASGGV